MYFFLQYISLQVYKKTVPQFRYRKREAYRDPSKAESVFKLCL